MTETYEDTKVIPPKYEEEGIWGYYEPAARVKMAAEIAGIVLLATLTIAIVFLVGLGCYTLVQYAP